MKRFLYRVTIILLCLIMGSCTNGGSSETPSDAESVNEMSKSVDDGETIERQGLESVVMAGEEWRTLRFSNISANSFRLSSGPSVTGTVYEEGVDYELDCENGRIRRLSGSKIPDFSLSLTYNAEPKSVDLGVMTSGFHALPYTTYANYSFNTEGNETYSQALAKINKRNRSAVSQSLLDRIAEGGDFVYAVVGDSISTGCEASSESAMYFQLFAAFLKSLNRSMNVTVVNVAVGGEDSTRVEYQIQKLYEELGVTPDLITIAYGMNDQNSLGDIPYISPARYVENHEKALAKIASYCETMPEIIMITAMPANPIWNYCSGASELLADELRDWAKEKKITVADPGALFASELSHGKSYTELITSNINHPGDYGHKLYFTALKSLFESE